MPIHAVEPTNLRQMRLWLAVTLSVLLLNPHAAMSASDTSQDVTPQPATTTHILLNVPRFTQGYNLCVPTCASMALAYYGDFHDQHELKALSLPPNNTFWGTYYKDMAKGVAKLGYQWQVREYPDSGLGYEAGLNDIIASLRLGRPILVETPDHTILAVGVDTVAGQIAFLNSNPSVPAPGLVVYRFDDFARLWHEDPSIGPGRWAIFTAPKPGDKVNGQSAASGGSLPPSCTYKVTATPDFYQEDPRGNFPNKGMTFCTPTSVSDSFMYLATHGFERLLPPHTPADDQAQIDLIDTLASPRYLDNDSQLKGTNATSFLWGVRQYVTERGYVCKRLEYEGDYLLGPSVQAAKISSGVDIDWIKAAIANPNCCVWLQIGYYVPGNAPGQWTWTKKHTVAVVGYQTGTPENAIPTELLVHNPVRQLLYPPSTPATMLQDDVAYLTPLDSGELDNIEDAWNASSDGHYFLSGPGFPPFQGVVNILDGALVLEIAKPGDKTNSQSFTSGDSASATPPTDGDILLPLEMLLSGKVAQDYAGQGPLTMIVSSVQLYGQLAHTLDKPRSKEVILTQGTHIGSALGPAALHAKAGDPIRVIGLDHGVGKSLTARLILTQ